MKEGVTHTYHTLPKYLYLCLGNHLLPKHILVQKMIQFTTQIGTRNRIQIPFSEMKFSGLEEGDVVEITITKKNSMEDMPISTKQEPAMVSSGA